MILTLILAMFISCNRINNLKNSHKFRLTEPQEDKIKKGDIESLRSFLKNYGGQKDERSSDKELPILYLIKNFNSLNGFQKEETEKILLENIEPYVEPIDARAKDKEGNTALHYCVKKDYFQIAQLLLQKNTDNYMKFDLTALLNDYKESPFYLSIDEKKTNFLELFLDSTDDLNEPFIFACLLGRDDILELILKRGFNIKNDLQLMVLTGSPLPEDLKKKLAENYIKLLSKEDFESALWIFEANKFNNFNNELERININSKYKFSKINEEVFEASKKEIRPVFNKYNMTEIIKKELMNESEKNKSKNNKKRKKIKINIKKIFN